MINSPYLKDFTFPNTSVIFKALEKLFKKPFLLLFPFCQISEIENKVT